MPDGKADRGGPAASEAGRSFEDGSLREGTRRLREHLTRGLTVREAATRVKVGKTAFYEALRAEPA